MAAIHHAQQKMVGLTLLDGTLNEGGFSSGQAGVFGSRLLSLSNR
jgi:hypothetical protein